MAETSIAAEERAEIRQHNRLVDLIVRMRKKPLGAIGAALVLVLLFAAICADLGWLGLPQVGLSLIHI